MLILVARYTFFFWLFIGNSNAERILLKQIVEADEDIYRLSACTARCLYAFGSTNKGGGKRKSSSSAFHSNEEESSSEEKEEHEPHPKKFTLQQCFNECNQNRSGTANIQDVKRIEENLSLQLVCRDDQNLHFRIDSERAARTSLNENSRHLQRNTDTFVDDKQVIFFIRINRAKDPEHFRVYLTDENYISFGNLTHNTTYNVTAVAIHANNHYSVISQMMQFQTLQRGYIPGKVTDMRVIGYNAMPQALQENRLTANIMWKPAKDMTCHYNIICFSTESAEYDMAPLEIRNPRQLYTYGIENLTFATEYKVGIRAKNTNNESKESELEWMTFRAPSCVEYYDYNFQICPPPEPEELNVEKTYIRENVYSLNISWQLPQYLPDYYELKILDLTTEGASYERNISKYSNNYYFDEITLCGFMYEVHLTAYTAGGNSTTQLGEVTQTRVAVPDQNHRVKLISAIFAPIFCIVSISLTTFIVCYRRAKLKRYQERCKYFEELEKEAPIDPRAFDFSTTKPLPPRLTSENDLKQFQLDLEEKIFFNDDTMEIERSDVTLHEILGEGAFGLVRRGMYHNRKSGEMHEVAVKMLKEQPAVDDVRAFRREIEVMKSVEQHPNIISLFGHCTKRYSEMLLLTEYCSLGNLLDFLRDEWKYLHDMQLKTITTQALQVAKKNEKTTFSINYKPINNNNKNNNLKEIVTFNHISHSNNKIKTLKSAAINKSYGYDEICTNFCKCQVEILKNGKFINTVISKSDEFIRTTQFSNCKKQRSNENLAIIQQKIAISDCECQQQQKQQQRNTSQLQRLLMNKNNKSNVMEINSLSMQEKHQQQQFSVENKSYFKCMEELKQHQHQQQHQEAQIKNITNANTLTTTQTAHITQPTTALNTDADSTEIPLQREPLKAADLLDIAKQVAIGMEFLAKNKVVHRDLAARNVLVAKDRTVKIADFGLSRDIYQENIYKKTGNGKLPIKWLALESMTHQVYTTQSDVWSYGILLYEIVTLGGTPYPAIPTNRLLHMLKTGYRMEKPKNCGEEFYDLMASCWHGNPGERPTFTEIIKAIDTFMCDDMHEQQIETAMLTTMQARRKADTTPADSVTDDAYLKPL